MAKLWLVSLVALVATVHAEPRKWTGYKVVPMRHPPAAAVSSNIIYLHRCPPGGCFVHAALVDDSRTDTSSIADPGDHTLSEFKETDQVWQSVVQCVRDTYAAFDVTITDVDPGNVPHFEEMVGGTANQLLAGFNNAGGIAPFDCAEIPNGLSFTFDVYGNAADELCWTVAQETAHTLGLEHVALQKDPMTYIQGDLPKRFQWQNAPCGTNVPAQCMCPRGSQNSYQILYTLFGVGAATPPTVTIATPRDGNRVTPSFKIVVDAVDDAAIDHLELFVDGAMVDQLAAMPFVFTAPTLDLGPHTIEVHAIDVTQMPAATAISVTQGPPCHTATDCDGTDVCVSGSCIAGPGEPGGLGSFCQSNQQCLSMLCAAGPDGPMHCTAPCDPAAASSCPSNFDCLAAGSTNVCWPSGGCCSIGGDPKGSAMLGGTVLVLALRRRRRDRSAS